MMVPPQWMLVSQPEQLLHSQAQKCFPIEAKRKRKLIQLVESVTDTVPAQHRPVQHLGQHKWVSFQASRHS